MQEAFLISTDPESSWDTGEGHRIGFPLNWILKLRLNPQAKRVQRKEHWAQPQVGCHPSTPQICQLKRTAIDSALAGSPLKRFLRTEKLLPSFPPCECGHSSLVLWKSYFYPDGEHISFHFDSFNALHLHQDKISCSSQCGLLINNPYRMRINIQAHLIILFC